MRVFNIDLEGKTVLVTGVAGFIGSYLTKRLLEMNKNITVIGIDNLNDYYSVDLKISRMEAFKSNPQFVFVKGDLHDYKFIKDLFIRYEPEIVVNLAAQAGVRYSITNPDAYIESNLIGFYNILEACRYTYIKGKKVEHLVFASSSSVYGLSKKISYSVKDKTDQPISLYAATKKSNELMAYSYSKLFGFPSTGLRFFTVYGPAGRPDMAYFSFTNKLIAGEKIQIFNFGNCKRDFTYIDDIVNRLIYSILLIFFSKSLFEQEYYQKNMILKRIRNLYLLNQAM